MERKILKATIVMNSGISSGDGNTFELPGWVVNRKGRWESGTYKYEIWYGDRCLKSHEFMVR
ncbi:hypothetical protein E5358_13915 [Palleniella muris]|uniref:Uncharacterized protein n=1 Tax=Palleniella muris TaxID=3038145 RepID=A0AC61QLV9_9BACT|nr:hypothetical protein [Palleniella muris]TGX80034.1 hypothetical protein E5358_13915 [Palleniella muris]